MTINVGKKIGNNKFQIRLTIIKKKHFNSLFHDTS